MRADKGSILPTGTVIDAHLDPRHISFTGESRTTNHYYAFGKRGAMLRRGDNRFEWQ
jgi:hypothetical protein